MHILLRRLLIAVPTLALLSLTVFLLLELAPGDAAMIVLDGSASGEQEAAVRESLGLNQSVLERYVRYMVGLLRGDFGRSAVSGQLVSEAIALRLPYTIGLLSLSIVLGLVCGMLLGLIGALRHDTAWDVALTGLISITTALPVFWVALLLVNVLAVQ